MVSSIAASVGTTAAPALDLAFSANSQFLYVLNGGPTGYGGITGYKVYGDGSLSQVTSISSTKLAASQQDWQQLKHA